MFVDPKSAGAYYQGESKPKDTTEQACDEEEDTNVAM